MYRLLFLTTFCGLAASAAEHSDAPLRTAHALDLSRYEGRWYEIARKPNRFQKDCAGDVLVHYTLRGDGRVDVFNQCSEADGSVLSASGVARRPDPERSPAQLEVRFAPAFLSFIPAVWGDYWVMDLDPEYRWAVVGEPGRKYFWVLSRMPSLPAAVLDGILERAKAQGYDLSDLIRTRHGLKTVD